MAIQTKPTAEKTSYKGREHYSHAILDAKKDKRRKEGEERDWEHKQMTIAQRISKAKSRRGESKKELVRLAKMEAEQAMTPKIKAPIPTPAAVTENKYRHRKSDVVEAAKTQRPSKS